MNISQLFSIFDRATSAEQAEAFQITRDQLQQIALSVDSYEAARLRSDSDATQTNLDALFDQLAGANWSSLLQLQGALPFWSRARFRTFRQQLVEKLTELKDAAGRREIPVADHWQRTLTSMLASLQDWEERALKAGRRRKLAMGACTALALVGGPIFIFFQFRLGGIELERAAMFFPAGPYGAVTSGESPNEAGTMPTLSALPADRESYMAEFSRFYFGHPTTFAKRYLEQPKRAQEAGDQAKYSQGNGMAGAAPGGQMIHLWKVLLRNTSLRRPEYVSSVETTVKLVEAGKFPWNQLDADPDLSLERADAENVRLRKAGNGPAFNLSWRIETLSGEVLGEGRQWIVDQPEQFVMLTRESEQWAVLPLHQQHPRARPDEKGPFLPELYFALAQPPADFDNDRAETIDELDPQRTFVEVKRTQPTIYEKIWTLDRLGEVTRTLRGEQFNLTVTYESIMGDERTIRLEDSLPPAFVWYQTSPRLLAEHPLGRPHGPGPSPGGSTGSRGGGFAGPLPSEGGSLFATYAALAHAFTPPESDPEAANQLTGSIDVDLSRFGTAHQYAAAHQFDQLLAPGGRISLYTKAAGMQTGLYHVQIKMNGHMVTEFQVDAFGPERQRFPSDRREQWDEVKRIRAAIGKPIREPDPLMLEERSLECDPCSLIRRYDLWQDLREPIEPEPGDTGLGSGFSG